MTQPDFDFTAPTEKRPHKRVRDTSKTAYAFGRLAFKGRKGDVLRWLAGYWNSCQRSPTSAEIALWGMNVDNLQQSWDWILLYARRGVSDLHRTGVIEHVPTGARLCMVTKTQCHTWRVREVGSEESR